MERWAGWVRQSVVLVAVLLSITGSARAQSSTQEATVLAAGDVAMCHGGPADKSVAARTAALIERLPGTILAVGDLAYYNGSADDFAKCYHPTWGRFKNRTLPVPGNHEYDSKDAGPYFDYFGSAAGERGKGYYAVQVGAWRVIGLNSNIDTAAGSEQERWLREELKTNRTRCTLAFWHHPLFSSGVAGGSSPHMRPLFQALYDAGAEIVIAGHDHIYERFAPQRPDGTADPARGIRQFIVGTAGGFSTPIGRKAANSEVRETDIFGVLKLTLRPDSYAWEFLAIDGDKFRDSGEAKCHD